MVISAHLIGSAWLLPLAFMAGGIAWFIPIIASLVAGAIANRAKGGGKNQGDQGGNRDPGVPTIGAQNGLIGEAGSPLWPGSQPVFPSNWQQQATGQGGGGGGGGSSTSTSRSVSDTSYNNLTVPYILPKYQPLESSILGAVFDRVNQPYALPRGYQALGLSGINDAFDLTGQTLQNRLVGSGLSGGMEAGALGGFEAQRAKALSGFTNELPLQERDQRTQDLQLASTILESFGRGQKSSGTQHSDTRSTSTGTSSGGGGGAGVQIPMLGDAIAQQYFSGQQGGQAGGSWFDKALGYAALVAGIYASIKGAKGGGGKTYTSGGMV